jgi:aspartate ammonia-lyase
MSHFALKSMVGGISISQQNKLGTRTEADHFGEINIPQSALYGIQTVRTVQNLSFSGQPLKNYPEYIVSLARVKKRQRWRIWKPMFSMILLESLF